MGKRRSDSIAAEQRIYQWLEDNGYFRIGFYTESKEPIEAICPYGHSTAIKPNAVFTRGDSCSACSGRDELYNRRRFYFWLKESGYSLTAEYVRLGKPVSGLCPKEHPCTIYPSAALGKRNAKFCKTCAGLTSEVAAQRFYDALSIKRAMPLEDYVKSTQRVLCACEYGHPWRPLPGNVVAGHGCGICENNNAAVAEANFRVRLMLENVVIVGEYINGSIPVHCICPEGHDCYPRGSDAKTGGKYWYCLTCNDRSRAVEAEANFRADALRDGSQIVGEYLRSHLPVECICPNGHTCWPCPRSIRLGFNWCICQSNAPQFDRLYLISKNIEGVVWGKLGLASSDRRFQEHRREGWKLEAEFIGLLHREAIKLEQFLLEALGDRTMLRPDQMPQHGWTETFPYGFMPVVKQLLLANFTSLEVDDTPTNY